MQPKELLEKSQKYVDVKVTLKPEAIANDIYDKAVYPLLEKLTDFIPTEIDDALLASKKEELKKEFAILAEKGLDLIELKTGIDLDGDEE